MRILHIYSGNLYGGIESLLLTVAKTVTHYPEMHVEFALCFDSRLSRELSAHQKVHLLGDVRLRLPWTWLRARKHLKATLEKRHFDVAVCHAPWSQAIFGPVVKSAGVPLVFSFHDATNGQHWIERLARQTRPDLVLCNSRFTESTLSRLHVGVQVTHIYWPVSPHSPVPTSAREEVRAKLKTPESDVVIVQTSRLERWKGHLLHLEALSRLVDLPNWTCWQVGGPQKTNEADYLDSLKAEASRLRIAHRIRFLGQREDVGELLSAADIHCQPNIRPEPFGRAFIEALAAGLPVVTTAMGAALEIVEPSCGILVRPSDPDALAAALRTLVSDRSLCLAYAAAGKKRAEMLCDPRKQIMVMKDIFESVLAKGRAA